LGTPPFHGRAPQQLLAAQLTEPPPPIGSRRYDVPGALATLIMKLLEKDPSKRPKTANEVARSLEDPSVVSGTFTSATAPKRTTQKPKRVIWALAGAGILASVAGRWRVVLESSRCCCAGGRHCGTHAGGEQIDRRHAAREHQSRHQRRVLRGGMTAEITNALSRIPGLRVASGNESAARDRAATPTDIGKALNVNMVLFGTVPARQDASSGDGSPRQQRRRIHRVVGHVRARGEGRFQSARTRSPPRS
jgi:serine/threonine-protein kinase